MSNISKWKIALLSTSLDLHDLRSRVTTSLKETGFNLLAFEDKDFIVEPLVSSHEACLIAVQQCDIAILIIDRRSGGLYLGIGPETITEAEFERVQKTGKIVIPCVRKEAENERHMAFTQLKESQKKYPLRPLDEIKKGISLSYVDNWKVLEFIEKVRKSDLDNFIIYFDNVEDLVVQLQGRLRNLTRYIAQMIAIKQAEHVKKIKTSVGLYLSVGDILTEKYFIESVPYKIQSGVYYIKHNESANKIISLPQSQNASILVIGLPGTGKSTLLIKGFLEHVEKCILEKSRRVPFYLSLRGKGIEYHFNIKSYIDDSCREYLQKEMFPIFDLGLLEPVFYIDGFDELAEVTSKKGINHIRNSEIFSHPLILCSRTLFARMYVGVELGDLFNIIMELSEWKNENSWDYIKIYCKIRSKPDIYNKLITYYKGKEGNAEFFKNPLLLTMFLWIIEESDIKLPLSRTDNATIIDEFINHWIEREIPRYDKFNIEQHKLNEDIKKRVRNLKLEHL